MIDQFLETSREFARKRGEPHFDIPLWVMGSTGGIRYVEPVGGPDEARERFARGEEPTLYTDEQLRDWLTSLVEQRHMEEDFLVVGLMRYIEMQLEALAEDSARGKARARRVKGFLEGVSADPVRAADMVEEFNRQRPPNAPSASVDDLPNVIKAFEDLGTPSTIERLRDYHEALEVWRELTAPLYLSAAHANERGL